MAKKKTLTRRKCSKCQKTGHNARTCKKRTSKKTVSKKKTTKKKTKKVTRKKKVSKAKTRKGGYKSSTSRGRGYSTFGGKKGVWYTFHFGGKTKKGNKSNKTWAIQYRGRTVVTRFGKTHGQKRETTKTFGSEAAAARHAHSLMKSKLNKGYRPVGTAIVYCKKFLRK